MWEVCAGNMRARGSEIWDRTRARTRGPGCPDREDKRVVSPRSPLATGAHRAVTVGARSHDETLAHHVAGALMDIKFYNDLPWQALSGLRRARTASSWQE